MLMVLVVLLEAQMKVTCVLLVVLLEIQKIQMIITATVALMVLLVVSSANNRQEIKDTWQHMCVASASKEHQNSQ